MKLMKKHKTLLTIAAVVVAAYVLWNMTQKPKKVEETSAFCGCK